MLYVPAPSGNFLSEYKASCDAKRDPGYEATLKSLEVSIKDRYDEYQKKKERLETVSVIKRGDDEINALKSCYSQTLKDKLEKDLRKRIAKLRSGVDNLAGDRKIFCPYCQIERAGRWDHFLPSSIFPDFYMYSPNLIYVCSYCNSDVKGNRLVHPERKTVNPYYDEITKFSYLECRVNFGASVSVSFGICCPEGADKYIYAVMKEHFDAYGLKKKFESEASSKISRFLDLFDCMCDAKGGVVSQGIIDELVGIEVNSLKKTGFGDEYWEIVMWKAIGGASGFLRYLETRRQGGSGLVGFLIRPSR